MRVKFEDRRYKVTFGDGIVIQWIKMRLFCKRQIRRIRVVFLKQDIGMYCLITLFWVMFGAVMFLLGQHWIATEDAPYTLENIAWDLSEGWFSSVILSFVIGAFVRISEYRRKLRSQHRMYVSTMRDFEKLTEPYIGNELNNYHPLYCDKCLEDTISYIKRTGKHIKVTANDNILIVETVDDRLKKLVEEIKSDDIVSFSTPLTEADVDEVKMELLRVVLADDLSPNGMSELLTLLKKLTDKVRQPWRVDIKYKMNILQKLNKNQDNQILSNSYYNMLLQGHPFPIIERPVIRSESLSTLISRLQQQK